MAVRASTVIGVLCPPGLTPEVADVLRWVRLHAGANGIPLGPAFLDFCEQIESMSSAVTEAEALRIVRRKARASGAGIAAEAGDLPISGGGRAEMGSAGMVASMKTSDVSARLGVGTRRVRQLAGSGRLRGFLGPAGGWVFDAGDVERFAADREDR